VIRRSFAPALIAATKLVVTLVLLWSGFRSISDDDFARVAIAQAFAVHPHLDPSGTSWLPLPFWVYGGVMQVFGATLATAQITAILLGVYAAVGVWLVARALELGPRAALFAGLIAASFPHAARYGAAMVPDYPTAVLALAAAATLGSQHRPTRVVGALSACLATLCRYETWPIAGVVMAYALFDAARQPRERRWLLSAACLAPCGAVAWMLHGFTHHQDAFFFLKRVAAYRRALGGDSASIGARLVKQPLALFTGEPELVLLVLALPIVVMLVHGRRSLRGRAWERPAVALGSLAAFLVIGDLLDGAATHHEDRTLLVAWLAMAILVAELLARLLGGSFAPGLPQRWQGARHFPKPAVAFLGVLTAVVAMTLFLRPRLTKLEAFVDRSAEIRIGQVAAALVPEGERLAVYTEDYGFFAVQAAFARPEDSAPLLRHDPRHQEQDPLASPEALARRLDAQHARYLVVPAGARQKLHQPIRVVAQSSGFALLVR
jgi:hypothetical protein